MDIIKGEESLVSKRLACRAGTGNHRILQYAVAFDLLALPASDGQDQAHSHVDCHQDYHSNLIRRHSQAPQNE